MQLTKHDALIESTVVFFFAANNVPIARNDAFTTPQNTPISGSLTGNDVPSAAGGNVWTPVTPGQRGTVVVNADGTFTYTPNAGYSGTDTQAVFGRHDVDGKTPLVGLPVPL